jgi:hydroxyethylthiazole kinase-like sugar kinase family protein
LFPYALIASNFTNYLTAADSTGAATFTLLQNGSPSALAVSSGEGETGYITDNTDTVDFAAGDTCANRIVGTGVVDTSVTWASATLLLHPD